LTLVAVGPDAWARLTEHAPADALVVMDANTREAAGGRVTEALGPRAGTFVFAERSGLVAGIGEAEQVRAALGPDTTPVAVGSGVITDIVRYASHLAGRDFISVPTAASMDGYASSVAAMQIHGVKVTYAARAPTAIFADPEVVARAPAELTRAGIGDLLAKATARVDWLAAHLLYGEEFSPAAADRMLEPLSFAAANAKAILSGDPGGARALLEGLIESGIAMAMVGNSRPASGCEHHASHFWDLQASLGRRAHASHGLQVAYATRFAIRLQRFAYGGGVGRLSPAAAVADPLGPQARRWLGDPVPEEIVTAVEEKQRFVERGTVGDWVQVRRALAPELARFDAVERALDAAGIPAEPGWLEIDEEMLRAAFRFGSRLRARYTVVDFLEGQGVLEEAVQEMVG
jgi:glycerol-1-phosphate dehydrogenase [NAD(P)+]